MPESFKLSISNPTNSKLETNLFKVTELIEGSSIQVTPDDRGKVFNITEGAANGTQLQSNVNDGAFYDTLNKILYVANFSGGLWIYNVETDTGSLITTLTDINGDRMPYNTVYCVKKDVANNILYVVSGIDVWIYDIENNTGKRYSYQLPSVDSGDELPAQAGTLDFAGNYLYVAGQTFLWRLNLTTRAGEDLSTVIFGDNYPTVGTARDLKVDSSNNLVFVSKRDDGLFSYNYSNGEGKIFNSVGGAANGQQLPNNNTGFLIAQNGDFLFVPTEAGIWIYNIQTDTGSVINNSTVVNGDSMPNDFVNACNFSPSENKLYVGGSQDWRYDFDLDEGEILGVVQNGVSRPVGTPKYISYDSGSYWSVLGTNGIWQWVEDNQVEENPIKVTSNEEGYYEELLGNLQSSPIAISKIFYQCDNIKQRKNAIKIVKRDQYGDSSSYMLQIMKFISPEYPYHVIPIELKNPIILDEKNFLNFEIEAQTQLNFIFEGEQLKPSDMIKRNINDEQEPAVLEVIPQISFANVKTTNTKHKFHPVVATGLMVATVWSVKFFMNKFLLK